MEENMSLDQLIDAVKQQLKIFNTEGLLKFRTAIDNFIIDRVKYKATEMRNEADALRGAANKLESELLSMQEKFGVKA